MIVLAAGLLGGIAGLAYSLTSGKRYKANASVLLLPPTAATATDQDPQRRADTLGLIAQSPAFAGRVGSVAHVSRRTVQDDLAASIDPNSNILRFTATDADPARAIAIARAAVTSFGPFVGILTGEVSSASILDRPTDATQIRPGAGRDGAVGITLGLIVGILLAAFVERRRPRRGPTDRAAALGRELEERHGGPTRRRIVAVTSLSADVAAAELSVGLARALATDGVILVVRDDPRSARQDAVLSAAPLTVREVAATSAAMLEGTAAWRVMLVAPPAGGRDLGPIAAIADEVILALGPDDLATPVTVAGITQVVILGR